MRVHTCAGRRLHVRGLVCVSVYVYIYVYTHIYIYVCIVELCKRNTGMQEKKRGRMHMQAEREKRTHRRSLRRFKPLAVG